MTRLPSLASKLLLAAVFVLVLAGTASGTASSAKLSARLTKTSFTTAQASSVKLVCKFPSSVTSFSYKLTLKSGKKWKAVKSGKKSAKKGACAITVKKLFGKKTVKVGSYKLKISVGSASKTLSFKVVKAKKTPKKPTSPTSPTTPTGSAPSNTALPTISGTVKDGQTLTAHTGTWSGDPTPTYTHQWQRCNSSGTSCTAIAGATTSTHGLVAADDDSTLRVVVTATNTHGSASATSAQTSAVSPIVKSASSGGKSSCAVLSDGKVECWGENEHGQLGDGATATAATPQTVSGITSAVQVSVGGEHACAVLSNGSVECWGSNEYGQLGNGATLPAADSDTPVQVYSSGTTPLTGVTQVSAGNIHTCALLAGGTLDCWGYNGSGELGAGPTAPSEISYPVPVYSSGTTLFSNVTQVSAGDQFTCAVAGGNASCWGSDTSWGLGNSSTNDQPNPVQIGYFGTSGMTVSSVSAGQVHACAVISASSAHNPGTVWCWGEDSYGELGNGPSGSAAKGPQEVVALNNGTGYLTGATAVSTGKWHTCAVVSGSVDCWGDNTWGQLGESTGNNTDIYYPVAAGSISTATALSSGDYFSCALLAGTIDCWGDNSTDQLGTGKIGSSQTPLTVSGSWATPSYVSVGGEHVCAIDSSDSSVWCWGRNNDGQLGNGSTTDSATPVKVMLSSTQALTGVTQLSSGGSHSCALFQDNSGESSGKVYCWGYNFYGQLGNGSTANSPYAVPVYSSGTTVLEHVIQVSAGDYHTCAVIYGGAAECWGYNNDGQLGNNLTSNSSYPVQVRGNNNSGLLAGVTQVSAGEYFSCAVAGGYAYCWGDNSYGQLGFDSANASSHYPMEVWAYNGTGLQFQQATSVSAGSDSACAVDSSGYAYCWGHNYFGQLGIGAASADKAQPFQVYLSGTSSSGTLLTGTVQVSVGPEHACVYRSYMTVTGILNIHHYDADCWGYNDTGQLGNGTLDDSSNPVSAIARLFSGVTEVSAGGSDNDNNGVSCAMVSGSVECWGSNYYGQMGSAALPTSVDPVAVIGLP